jgi:glycosyltransferase involved in cell wall biosynthesis
MNLEIFVLTYNRKESLLLSISSIIAQTYKNFKLIILDNASDYNVKELVSFFNDPRIDLIVNPINIGPVENYAKAIDLASKSFVMIFHDDDTLPSNFIENQMYLFEKHENIGFVVSGINLTDSMSKINYTKNEKLEYLLFEEKGEMLKCFYDYPTFGASSIMFKTVVAKHAIEGYKNFGNVVDRMILINCSRDHSFAYMINPKYHALQHESQDSSQRNWSFEYDINLSNLFLRTLKDFSFDEYKLQVVKSISEFYVYSNNKTSLLFTIRNIKFQDKKSIIYFIILLPLLYIKSKILRFVKKYFINFFIKLNHYKYEKKLRKHNTMARLNDEVI